MKSILALARWLPGLAVYSALCAAPGWAADRVDASTLNGKVLFGYQGWFDCPLDGDMKRSAWRSWAHGIPTAQTLTVDMYPDLREFAPRQLCAISGMTIAGKAAYLYSARSPEVVLRHFTWMKQYGLDGVLVQRFAGDIGRRRAGGDIVLKNIMAAAAQTGRTFAIEYDISGGKEDTFPGILEADWKYLVDDLKITAQPQYLHHGGKPVLSIWGMGLGESGHPPESPEAAKQIITWFKSGAGPHYAVTYMGGTPARWRTLSADSRHEPAWADVYRLMDVVQPWTVGRYRDQASADQWKAEVLDGDVAELKKNGQIYMAVVFPGFSWANLMRNSQTRRSIPNQIPRHRGEFLWRQAYNARAAGANVLKIAMFDEVNEGAAMYKIASHRRDAPQQGFWLTLDADGDDLPSDWYLRLAGEITRIFHGEAANTPSLPAQPRSAQVTSYSNSSQAKP